MNAGDTFIPSHPYNHLYVVISDPGADPERVLIVNFTSYLPEEEDCCIALAGEHPFLKRKSCVRYKDCRITTVSAILDLVKTGQVMANKPLSRELLARVRTGASESEFLPEGCRKILEDQNLI